MLRDKTYTKKKVKQLVGISTKLRKDRLVEKRKHCKPYQI